MSRRNDATVMVSSATATLARTVRSSNSSTDCHVRARPSCLRRCAAKPVETAPGQRHAPSVWHEARDGVDQGRLARAVGPDQPDDLARLDVQCDSVVGEQAAVARRSGPGSRDPARSSAHVAFSASAVPTTLRASDLARADAAGVLRQSLLGQGQLSGDADGVQDGGDHQTEAGDQEVVAVHALAEQVVEDHVADAERRERAGDQRARRRW